MLEISLVMTFFSFCSKEIKFFIEIEKVSHEYLAQLKSLVRVLVIGFLFLD
jgi:hypothetical protein